LHDHRRPAAERPRPWGDGRHDPVRLRRRLAVPSPGDFGAAGVIAGPPERLDDLIRYLQARLVEAPDRRDAAWRTPMLASVRADGAPSLRTVVLRSADPQRRILSVYTDRRSDKVAQLRVRDNAELGFWDPATSEQL